MTGDFLGSGQPLGTVSLGEIEGHGGGGGGGSTNPSRLLLAGVG